MASVAPIAAGVESVEVIITGCGFSGIGAAIKLRQAGIESFVILERSHSVGGTWAWNTYPGCACDIPSHLYCFSFAPNPDFSRVYSFQPEIRQYLEDCVDRYGLRSKIRFGADAVRHVWDDAEGMWDVECTDGRRFCGRFGLVGLGPFKEPRWPDVKGLSSFQGALMHSARWPEGGLEALAGKRVAVLGTGASAIQIIPEVAKMAARLHVVQRTPAWVAPRPDAPYSAWAKALFKYVPGALLLQRFLIWAAHEIRYPLIFSMGRVRDGFSKYMEKQLRAYIRHEIRDKEMAAALTPSYAPGCKRLLISSDFYPALARPNVSLHTQAVTEMTPTGLRLADGTHLDVDAVVCATGFGIDDPIVGIDIRGQGGVPLAELWAKRPFAHLGVAAPRFPNSFFMLGPNSGLGHNSVIIMAEAAAGYALQAIKATRARGPGAWVAVKPEAAAAFVAEVDARHARQVWASGCRSWYLNKDGVNFTLWPGSTAEYVWRLWRWDAASYVHGVAPGPAKDGGAADGGLGATAGRGDEASTVLAQRRKGLSSLL